MGSQTTEDDDDEVFRSGVRPGDGKLAGGPRSRPHLHSCPKVAKDQQRLLIGKVAGDTNAPMGIGSPAALVLRRRWALWSPPPPSSALSDGVMGRGRGVVGIGG